MGLRGVWVWSVGVGGVWGQEKHGASTELFGYFDIKI